MRLVDYVLDHILNHILDQMLNHMIIGLAIMALHNGYKEIDKIFYHQSIPFIPKTIPMELISRHYNNLCASYFVIKKTCELLAQRYYWLIFWYNVKAKVKGYDNCLALKAVCHKPYSNL